MSVEIKKYLNMNRNAEGYNSYKNIPHEFRPYVMFVNSPNYSSEHVNTDELGFRKSTNNRGENLSLKQLKQKEQFCNVLVGGSSAFGMGATSDKKTISSQLSNTGIFCQNFGVRGATSQQELIIFQNFKRFLPKIKNVYILSGVNDLALATEKSSFFYPEFGGIYSEEMRFYQFWSQYTSFSSEKWILGKNKFFFIIDYLCKKFSTFKKIFAFLSYILPAGSVFKKKNFFKNISFEQKKNHLKDIIKNDFDCWKALSLKGDFKITYILQPGIGWANKKLNEQEQFIYENQRAFLGKKFFDKFMNKEIYIEHKKFIQDQCDRNEIKFEDANLFVKDFDSDKNLFLDLCHLSDEGNTFLANYLQNNNA